MQAWQLHQHQKPKSQPTGTEISLASLNYISRDQLAQKLLETPSDASIAIIDVRDSDYIGGHIKGCINVPTQTLDYRLPELMRTLQDKETVVFHCALSQQRGPSSALRYMRERQRLDGNRELVGGESEGGEQKVKQRIYVLDGGFVKWQEKYGEDKRITEGYQKDIWEFGGY